MSVTDGFRQFFAEANSGAQPYPWQCRLVEAIAESGRWIDIAVPTGSGKSSVVDIHVFLVAGHAAGLPIARPPRRLFLVAPRRVLVDDQFERALSLASLLRAADDDSALGRASKALGALCVAGADSPAMPIGVWRLRGGVRLETGWRLEPAACQIVCSTPQMWGSRLLMRGYAASPASRNLESGLLGYDAVAVIDEAHLHERLLETGNRVRFLGLGSASLQVVGMSATARATADQAELSDADLTNTDLARRVRAVKRVELTEVSDLKRDAPAAVVEAARRLRPLKSATIEDSSTLPIRTVGVFVNDVPSALAVASELRKDGSTVELVCGRMRTADLNRLRERRPTLLTAVGDPEVDFLVSTQSLEVGVDLDLPAMVTMIASATALAQRAGRLNRSGRYEQSTFVVITESGLADLDPDKAEDRDRVKPAGPYDGEHLIRGARWLDDLRGSISPESITALGLPVSPRPLLPALRRVDLETLAFTSNYQSADPDPDLYIDDPRDERREIGIAARRYLDCEPEVTREMLIACPPRAHEIVTIALSNRKEIDWILNSAGEHCWVLRYESGELTAVQAGDFGSLRSDDTLVVPDGAPICTAGLVGNRTGTGRGEPFADVLADAPSDVGHDHIIKLRHADVEQILMMDSDLASRAARVALADVLESESQLSLVRLLRTHRRLSELDLRWCGGVEAEEGLLVVLDMSKRTALFTAAEPDQPVTLDSHQAAVADRMRRLLEALGLDLTDADRGALEQAAASHDEGKRHPYFQARVGRRPDDEPLAKARPGHRPDRGDGWRHEQLSAAYVFAVTQNDPTVVTLVAAHHGHGRTLFDRGSDDLLRGWEECPATVVTAAHELFGPGGRYELLRARSERRYGVHQLAWLEALLRCADMQVSREGR